VSTYPTAHPQGGHNSPMPPGMQAPMPVQKPGAVTGAAVLAFIQAGITLITTGIIFFGLIGTASADVDQTMGWVVAIAQLAGLILLIVGAVQLMSGSSRVMYLVAVILELVICGYYLVQILGADAGGISALEDMKGAATVIPIVFAVMPLIGLFLALGSATGNYIQAKRGR
jgi:hypothetical protein